MDIHALEQEVLALEYETCEDWVRIQELESLEITRLTRVSVVKTV